MDESHFVVGSTVNSLAARYATAIQHVWKEERALSTEAFVLCICERKDGSGFETAAVPMGAFIGSELGQALSDNLRKVIVTGVEGWLWVFVQHAEGTCALFHVNPDDLVQDRPIALRGVS